MELKCVECLSDAFSVEMSVTISFTWMSVTISFTWMSVDVDVCSRGCLFTWMSVTISFTWMSVTISFTWIVSSNIH